jgi:hypothetical protein
MKIEFEKQFGKGVDPWYAKAERWAKKQKFPISFLALGIIAYLKKVWINVKIENTMKNVDRQVEDLHELWDEEETNNRMNVIAQNGNDGLHYSETPSEVDGLNDMSISFSKEEDPSSDDTHSF